MPPLLLFDDDDYAMPVVNLWGKGWFTRMVSQKGKKREEPFQLPSISSSIPSFSLIPHVGLIFPLPNLRILLIHSLSDGITSLYAGGGSESQVQGFRTRTLFHQPSSLCFTPHSQLIVTSPLFHHLQCIQPDGQVSLLSKTTETSPIHFQQPSCITNCAKGGFLILEANSPIIKHIKEDGSGEGIKLKPFDKKSIVSNSSTLLPLTNGRNLILSQLGLFSILDDANYKLIVDSKALGFTPSHALELNANLFLISNDQTTFVVDTSQFDSGIVTLKRLGEVLGQEQIDSDFLDSISGPFCFDESSGTIWAISGFGQDNLLVTIQLKDVMDGLEKISSSITVPSSDVIYSFEMAKKFIGHKDPILKFKVIHLTTGEPQISFKSPPASSLAVTPTHHVLEVRKNDIRWFNEVGGVFEHLAGEEIEKIEKVAKIGISNGPRREVRFGGLGSVCFVPLHPIGLGEVVESPSLTTKEPEPINLLREAPIRSRWPVIVPKFEFQDLRTCDNQDNSGEYNERRSYQEPEEKEEKMFLLNLIGSSHRMVISDTETHRLCELLLSGEVVTYIGSKEGRNDGPKSLATFSRPKLMTVGRYGEIFVTSANDLSIRRVSAAGLVTTLQCGFEEVIFSKFLANQRLAASYSGIAADPISGKLMLSYQKVMFGADMCWTYRSFCGVERRNLNPEKLQFPSKAFTLHHFIGEAHPTDHNDAHYSKTQFVGQISMAVLPEAPIFEKSQNIASSPLQLQHSLIILDRGDSSIRCLANNEVSTIAGGLHLKQGPREGFSSFSHIPSLQSIAPLDAHSIVANDYFGNLFLISHHNRSSPSTVMTGFRRFLPNDLTPEPWRLNPPQTGSSPFEAESPLSLAPSDDYNTQYNDFELSWFGRTLSLHRGILEARAPGLLEEDTVKDIELRAWLKPEDIGAILRAIYVDELWIAPEPFHLLSRSDLTRTFTSMAHRYAAISLIGCQRLIEAVEMQIQDLFRFVAQDPSQSDDDIDMGGGLDGDHDELAIGDSKHCGLEILAIIGDFSNFISTTQDGVLVANRLFDLYLPYAVNLYTEMIYGVSQNELQKLLPKSPNFVQRLLEQIFINRPILPAVKLHAYHQSWKTQWGALLTDSVKPEQEYDENGQIIPGAWTLPTTNVTTPSKTSLVPDITIVGKHKLWHAHRWILAAKCQFFELLFGSHFSDATSPSWEAPTTDSEPGYLDDEAMGAFLEYIYTDNPNSILNLNPSLRTQTRDTFPFYFVQYAQNLQSLIPDMPFTPSEADEDIFKYRIR